MFLENRKTAATFGATGDKSILNYAALDFYKSVTKMI